MDSKKLKQQLITWSIILVSFAGIVGFATLVSMLSQGGASIGTKKRFKAKTVSDQSKSLVFRRKGQAEDSGSSGGGQQSESGSNSSDTDQTEEADEGKSESPHEAAIEEALNALRPETGIDKLQEYLASLQNFEEASEIYCAIGTLHLQTSTPNSKLSAEAFNTATRLADSTEQKHAVAADHARSLIEQGKTTEALKKIEEELARDHKITSAGLQLSVMRGRLCEDSGRIQDAEKSYKEAMDNAIQFPLENTKANDAYRLAGMRLARLYRKMGKESNAEAVVRKVKARFEMY